MAHGSEEDLETSKVIQQMRVVSLCRFYSNALLWSYYAESYTGVCLALSFPNDTPEAVTYNGMEDDIWRDRLKGGHELAALCHVRRKLDFWKHEIEYRVIKIGETEEEPKFVPCTVHGVLFGANTPASVRSVIEEAGSRTNPDFFADTVQLNAGLSHPCVGSGLGVRSSKMNNPWWWLNDGAGPFAIPNVHKCYKCEELEIGTGIHDRLLEQHLTCSLDTPNYYAEKNTIMLCPNCHRKAHIDPSYLQ